MLLQTLFALSLIGTAQAEVRLIPFDDFRLCTRDRFIEAADSVLLAPSLLVTNEMGVTSRFPERLGSDRWARVTFDVPSAKFSGATLLFYVNQNLVEAEPMRIRVNGQTLFHRTDRERMLTGGWDRIEVPPAWLRAGDNEIAFSHSGVLFVDPGAGGHSSRSVDGGQTWRDDILGSDGDLRGEYMVRLRLRGHPPRGTLTSPVIDLADPEARGAIAADAAIGDVQVVGRQHRPPGTAILLEWRSGSTPSPDGPGWSAWTTERASAGSGRFLQWRAHLSTEAADLTPVLREVSIQADFVGAPNPRLRLIDLDQPARIARSSYAFESMAPHPNATRLLEENDFADVVARGSDELERFDLLREWVHSQWVGWQNDAYPYCPTWDPLEILHVTRNNLGYGMCTHYAAVFVGCAQALGYTARSTILDHHCVAEIWSESLQKWIVQDPGPSRDYHGYYALDGVPANALELHRALEQGRIGEALLQPGAAGAMRDNIAATFSRFGIALRNNYLVQAEPAEWQQGHDHYHWDGYLWWTDSLDPRYPEYSLQTARPEDLYWGVNQSRLYLQETDLDGALYVQVETATPNFSHFLVQLDDGEWERLHEPHRRWELHAGANSLRLRAVNLYGREGRIARALVEYRPAP